MTISRPRPFTLWKRDELKNMSNSRRFDSQEIMDNRDRDRGASRLESSLDLEDARCDMRRAYIIHAT
jgi:hypothetical protein